MICPGPFYFLGQSPGAPIFLSYTRGAFRPTPPPRGGQSPKALCPFGNLSCLQKLTELVFSAQTLFSKKLPELVFSAEKLLADDLWVGKSNRAV